MVRVPPVMAAFAIVNVDDAIVVAPFVIRRVPAPETEEAAFRVLVPPLKSNVAPDETLKLPFDVPPLRISSSPAITVTMPLLLNGGVI